MATSNSFGKSSCSEPDAPKRGGAETPGRGSSGLDGLAGLVQVLQEAPHGSVTDDYPERGLEARPEPVFSEPGSRPGCPEPGESVPRPDPHLETRLEPDLDLTRSTARQAGQAYHKSAGVRSGAPLEAPWEALDSGKVLWADFSPAEQEAIARHYAPKVKYLAARLKARLPRNVDLGELVSAGSMGLVESFSKFKPDLGVKFSTYAENRIRGAMLDELRRLDWFPRSLRQKVRQIDSAILQSEQSTGRVPNEAELASITGLSEKDVREGLEALQNQSCFSLDALENVLSGEDGPKSGEPYAETATREMIERMADLIEQLTPREKLVLSLYYSDELNMRETAEVMGITEGRVSQLHSQALGRLRKEFYSQHGLYSS